jgi:hypothetical protein
MFRPQSSSNSRSDFGEKSMTKTTKWKLVNTLLLVITLTTTLLHVKQTVHPSRRFLLCLVDWTSVVNECLFFATSTFASSQRCWTFNRNNLKQVSTRNESNTTKLKPRLKPYHFYGSCASKQLSVIRMVFDKVQFHRQSILPSFVPNRCNTGGEHNRTDDHASH